MEKPTNPTDLEDVRIRYLARGKFFQRDYGRDNAILLAFKAKNPDLDSEQVKELIGMLGVKDEEWGPRYFVADLLYYYEKFDASLMAPLLQTAIEHKDPSFNRIFLRPCLHAFGITAVVNHLVERFKAGSTIERLGIASLKYWLPDRNAGPSAYRIGTVGGIAQWQHILPDPHADISALEEVLVEAALNTDNLVELYYYSLALPHRRELFVDIPDGADALLQRIAGNSEYESLLCDGLGWQRREK